MKNELNHHFQFLSQINQELMKNESIDNLFKTLLEIITTYFKSRYGFIFSINKTNLEINKCLYVGQDNIKIHYNSFFFLQKEVSADNLRTVIQRGEISLFKGIFLPDTLNALFKDKNPSALTHIFSENKDRLNFIMIDGSKIDDIDQAQDLFEYTANQLALGYQKNMEYIERQETVDLLNNTFSSTKKLSRKALEGEGVAHVCEIIADIIQLPICLFDSFLYEKYASTSFTAHESFLTSTYMYDTYFHHSELTKKDNIGIYPIKIKKEILGFLLVQLDHAEVTDFIQMNMEHGLNIIALELLKEREILETKKQFAGEIISDYITNRKKHQFIEKLDTLGIDNQIPCYHIFFTNVTKTDLDKLLNIVYIESNRLTHLPILTPNGIVFFTKIGRKEIDMFIKRLVGILSRYNISPNINIGRKVKNILEIDISYKDATNMMRRGAYNDKQIIYFDDLTLENLFLKIDRERIVDFVKKTLNSLLSGEPRSKMLLETLITFIDNNKNHKQTCHALSIHINTLYYRLKMIEKELNVNLSNSEDLLSVHLATKLIDLLD